MVTELLMVIGYFFVGQVPEPSAPAPSGAPASETVDVRYARAQLQLAQANLQRVQQINQRLARTVPASVVAEYQGDLDVAKTQMQQAESRSVADGFSVWLRRAESIWKNADTIWKNAVTIKQRSTGTFETLDIERFRLRAEVTRLQLERGQLLVRGPRESQLQWQLDLVNNEVQRLKEESRTAPFARFWRVWW
jgi:uncharacterized protein YPO0396